MQINAENVKHVLSTLDTANCYIESLYEGIDFNANVSRGRFDNEFSKVSFSLEFSVKSLLIFVHFRLGFDQIPQPN